MTAGARLNAPIETGLELGYDSERVIGWLAVTMMKLHGGVQATRHIGVQRTARNRRKLEAARQFIKTPITGGLLMARRWPAPFVQLSVL